jgi:tetratricopeptide (TPR) repeat protein
MVARTHRVFAGLALVLALACGGGHGGGAPKSNAGATLSDRLKPLPPAEQLATLRPLGAADSSNADVAFHTGNAYYGIGSAFSADQHSQAVAYYDSAVAEYRRAVRADSTMSKAWVNMGLAYEAKGSQTGARKSFQSAIAVNPRDVLAYCHLGYVEQQSGNVSEAIGLYKQALAIDANCAQAHYNLGLAFAEAKVFKEALVEWETVVRLDPDGELGKTAAENVKIIKQYLSTTP